MTITPLHRVFDLPLSRRATNCMKHGNIIFIGDLVQHTEAEILRLPNCGKRTLGEVKNALAPHGLKLGETLANWPPANIEAAAAALAA